MATAPRRRRHSTGGTLLLTLALATAAFGLLLGTIALFNGLTFDATGSLTITPPAIGAPVAGACGAAVVLPAGLLLTFR